MFEDVMFEIVKPSCRSYNADNLIEYVCGVVVEIDGGYESIIINQMHHEEYAIISYMDLFGSTRRFLINASDIEKFACGALITCVYFMGQFDHCIIEVKK